MFTYGRTHETLTNLRICSCSWELHENDTENLKKQKQKKTKISLSKIVSYQLTKSDCQSDNKKNGLSDIIINNIIRVRALILTLQRS